MLRYKSKYKKVGVLPIRIVKSNVSSVGPSLERIFSDEGSSLETLDLETLSISALHQLFDSYSMSIILKCVKLCIVAETVFKRRLHFVCYQRESLERLVQEVFLGGKERR